MISVDLINIAILATVIALAFFAIRLLAGWLVSLGGAADPIGRAVLNVFP